VRCFFAPPGPEAADAGKSKIRGVNLGGWLVLEPWIVPSLFEQFSPKDGVVDQWTFCAHLGKKECKRQLEKHWDSWVTEEDMSFLSESGINHVRIPFGYWVFGDIRADEPWVDGELPYLERVVRWAAKYNMHVILDMHCAPGSQNGFDNSGRKGEVHFADEVKERYGRVSKIEDRSCVTRLCWNRV
jgi:glucan 1,3-beta-glucosidase